MNKKFDMEKNRNRYEKYLGENSYELTSKYNPLNNDNNIVGDNIETPTFNFIFISSQNPFLEYNELDGEWKRRKGMTVCYIVDPKSDNTQFYGVGFAICSDSDVFSHQEGYKKALLDAMYHMFEKALNKVKNERNSFIEHFMKEFLREPPREKSLEGLHSGALALREVHFLKNQAKYR